MRTFLAGLVLALGVLAAGHAHADRRGHGRGRARVRVVVAPPVLRVEERRAPPSVRHVYTPGYWSWSGRRYSWNAGRWVLPPRPAQVWIEPRWVQDGDGWVFEQGHWQTGNDSVETYVVPSTPSPAVAAPPPPPPPVVVVDGPGEEEWVVDRAPPPVRREPRPRAPMRGAVWVPGFWAWQGGDFVWMAGRWEAGRPGVRFIPGHWERRGPSWVWRRGIWRGRHR